MELGEYDGILVAGKTFLGIPDQSLVMETMDEVKFFMKLDHPNCHYMLGSKTTLEDGGILLLTEVCDQGSIYDMYSKGSRVFDMNTAWRLSRECALGLAHIHSMGYMHRDVKSLNVFLTAQMVAKVADFGMCTAAPTSSALCGTPQWMAPEVGYNHFVPGLEYDKSCDVYSHGILMWELFHSHTPYYDTGLDQMQILQHNVYHDMRPNMSPRVPGPIKEVIQKCWARTDSDRPTFQEVISMLDDAQTSCK